MVGKFAWLIAFAVFVPLAGSGCHTIGGTRYHEVGGACQKGVCQKGICQKSGGGCDGGYRGCALLDSLSAHFWGCSGCGEVYWNEWQYDPPDCCDPCDDCYGQFVGPRDCCKKKFIIDPVLWVAAIKGKHCRQGGWYDPCGNWHCYGDGNCGCGGCGKGGMDYSYGYGHGQGQSYGDVYQTQYLGGPSPEPFRADGTIDNLPDPSPTPAVHPGRVANRNTGGEARQAPHELRR